MRASAWSSITPRMRQHRLGEAERALLLELVLEDVLDVAAPQEVELGEQHVALGQQPEVGELGRGDAQRAGELLDPGHGLARRHAVGQRHDQHAVDELLAQLGAGEALGELGRRDRRQGVDVGVDAQDDLLRGFHHRALRRADRAGGGHDRLHGAQAEQGGGGIGLNETHGPEVLH